MKKYILLILVLIQPTILVYAMEEGSVVEVKQIDSKYWEYILYQSCDGSDYYVHFTWEESPAGRHVSFKLSEVESESYIREGNVFLDRLRQKVISNRKLYWDNRNISDFSKKIKKTECKK